jgi:hypothetical protein
MEPLLQKLFPRGKWSKLVVLRERKFLLHME